MKGSIKVGQFRGIPVGLHWSWFPVFILVSWSLASGYFYVKSPALPGEARWIFGIFTGLLFFGSVLAHEFGHAVIALRNHVPVQSVTLFILGGVAHISREPRTPGAELRIAIAGPLTSLGLGVIFSLVTWILPGNGPLDIATQWLAQVNLILAVFNMIPGFPLDGGRVLRALLWWYHADYARATRLASFSGQLVAIGFFGFGIYSFFGGNAFNGIWLAFLGWFLQSASSAAASTDDFDQRLEGLKVENMMNNQVQTVPVKITLSDLIENQFMRASIRYFIVAEQGEPKGILTIQELTEIPREAWATTTAEQVMTPWENCVRIQPETELAYAVRLMQNENVEVAPVLDGAQVAGILSQGAIRRYLQVRARVRPS